MMQQEKLPGFQRILQFEPILGPQGLKMVDIKHSVGAMQTVDFC
jgi:hypothetical protein